MDATEPGTGELATDILDLSTCVSLTQARQVRAVIEPPMQVVLSQVARPRVNLGTGPPGRAD